MIYAAISFALQTAVLVLMMDCFNSLSYEINGIIHVFAIITVLFIINEKSNPAIKTAWIVFILAVPVFGCVMYILLGGKPPRKRLIYALNKAEMKNKAYKKSDNSQAVLKSENEHLYTESRYLENMGFPLRKNTDAKYFPLGEDAFPVMLEEMKKAKRFIFLEYFIIADGKMLSEIEKILIQKANEGVEVRLIYDDMGSLLTIPSGYEKRMEEKGVKCLAFNPFKNVFSASVNNRDHRKILVIDANVAFTGGINIADEYINRKEKYGHWKDNAVMVKGDAAKEFAVMFLDIWNAFRDKDENIEKFLHGEEYNALQKGFAQPFSDTPLDDEKVGENVYLDAINGAKNYIYIYTPYLIPDYEINSALCLAAKKGVDVKLAVPGIPDKKIVYSMTKSYYGMLIDAGVEIYKYPIGFVHAKGFVSDDNICCVGTINLDFRSMCHHFECGCVFYNAPVVADMKADFLSTVEKCEKVTSYQRFKGFIGSTYYALLRLIAPLM